MSISSIKVPFSTVKHLVKIAFGENYKKSRKPVSIHSRETYRMFDLWDGGSKNECSFIDVATMQCVSSKDFPPEYIQKEGNPYNLPIANVKLHPTMIVVEHMIFQGKSIGYSIYCHPTFYQYIVENKDKNDKLLEEKYIMF